MVAKTRTKKILEGELKVAGQIIEVLGTENDRLKKRLAKSDLVNSEIKELKSKLEEASQLALIDGLTGIYNHRHITNILNHEIARSRKAKGERRKKITNGSLCILMLDIDNFKKINDSLGHPAGDAVLKQFARALKEILRATDFYGRYGGEEFLIILPNTAKRGAAIIGGKLRKACENMTVHYEGEEIRITLSGGVAQLKANDDTFRLIGRADKLLYKAKGAGRNKIVSK